MVRFMRPHLCDLWLPFILLYVTSNVGIIIFFKQNNFLVGIFSFFIRPNCF